MIKPMMPQRSTTQALTQALAGLGGGRPRPMPRGGMAGAMGGGLAALGGSMGGGMPRPDVGPATGQMSSAIPAAVRNIGGGTPPMTPPAGRPMMPVAGPDGRTPSWAISPEVQAQTQAMLSMAAPAPSSGFSMNGTAPRTMSPEDRAAFQQSIQGMARPMMPPGRPMQPMQQQPQQFGPDTMNDITAQMQSFYGGGRPQAQQLAQARPVNVEMPMQMQGRPYPFMR